jgi:hypothetical protein
MKMSAVAETSFVEKTRKPTRPAAKPAAPRRRAPAKPAASTEPSPIQVEEPTPPRATRGRRRRRLAFASTALVVVAASAAAIFFLFLRGDDSSATSRAEAPAAVSATMLASFASAHDGPVYWVGPMASRKLELTATSAGTFVRYLPLGAPVGDSERAITVATYPMRDAFATATVRAKSPQMTSRETGAGALAVWSKTRPTSVYLAFPGVSQLIEVYSPDAAQARSLALSGRIRPVR